MYIIKQKPEDFIVKEISNVKVKSNGKYLYLKLIKKNRNTLDVVKELAKQLRIREKQIGFAGSKDKKAVTEQLISIFGISVERIKKADIENASFKFIGYGDKPISLGDLEGNYFEIVIRNLDDVKINIPHRIINYFDKQRFGENNIEIGKCLIKKNFKKACSILKLDVSRNDFVGALKKIPIRLLKLYVHAYQSYLWNKTVKEAVEKNIRVSEVQLVGFSTEIKKDKIIERIMVKEGINFNDFIIRQIPELSMEGRMRKVFVEVKDFKIMEKSEDELNGKKKRIKISFGLPKGSYATVVVKNLFERTSRTNH